MLVTALSDEDPASPPPPLPVELREDEIQERISKLSIGDDPVEVAFYKEDVILWQSFVEYRKNRRDWEAKRQDTWKEHHPPYISDLFNNWPILKTPRLRIRLLRASDDEPVFRLLSNVTAMKYYGSKPHADIEYTRKNYIEIMCMRFQYRDGVSFVITMSDDDKHIGQVNATQFDRDFKFTEISYIIDPEHWGMGIATEAVKRIVEFFFEEMKIHKIRASFYAKNVASRRVLEKVGFEREGYMKDNVLIDGKYEDEILMAIISKESEN